MMVKSVKKAAEFKYNSKCIGLEYIKKVYKLKAYYSLKDKIDEEGLGQEAPVQPVAF